MKVQETDTKYVGAKVSPELYWEFKKTYADRQETATQALENAIRLYLDVQKGDSDGRSIS